MTESLAYLTATWALLAIVLAVERPTALRQLAALAAVGVAILAAGAVRSPSTPLFCSRSSLAHCLLPERRALGWRGAANALAGRGLARARGRPRSWSGRSFAAGAPEMRSAVTGPSCACTTSRPSEVARPARGRARAVSRVSPSPSRRSSSPRSSRARGRAPSGTRRSSPPSRRSTPPRSRPRRSWSPRRPTPGSRTDRLHDRYLFYVVPLWLIVLVWWMRRRCAAAASRDADRDRPRSALALLFPFRQLELQDGVKLFSAVGTAFPPRSRRSQARRSPERRDARPRGAAARGGLPAARRRPEGRVRGARRGLPRERAARLGPRLQPAREGGLRRSRPGAALGGRARARGASVTVLESFCEDAITERDSYFLTEFFNDSIDDVVKLAGEPRRAGSAPTAASFSSTGAGRSRPSYVVAQPGVRLDGTELGSGTAAELVLWEVSRPVRVRGRRRRAGDPRASAWSCLPDRRGRRPPARRLSADYEDARNAYGSGPLPARERGRALRARSEPVARRPQPVAAVEEAVRGLERLPRAAAPCETEHLLEAEGEAVARALAAVEALGGRDRRPPARRAADPHRLRRPASVDPDAPPVGPSGDLEHGHAAWLSPTWMPSSRSMNFG